MIRFGTDGIRGRFGDETCNEDVAARIGAAAVRLSQGGRVLIGWDTRPSGPVLSAAVARGVSGAGGVPRFAGVVPTAAVATAVAGGLAEVGVMITASHNPAPDNGFKLFGPGGYKLSDVQNAQVEGWLVAEPVLASAPADDASDEVRKHYLSALRTACGDLSALEGKRIAVDLAHGGASVLGGALHELVDADWVLVGAGDGVINDGVGSQSPQVLQDAVRATGAVAGVAVDGDADRCVLVDELGQVVPGDVLAWWLCSSRRENGMAVTVMSTRALEAALPNVHIVRTQVGDRHLAKAMDVEGLALGCEESGHVLFGDGLVVGDGLLTGLRALSAALAEPAPLSQTLSAFRPWPRELHAVRVARRVPIAEEPRLLSLVARAEEDLGEGGRIFLRYSGTEPVLRVLVEGRDAQAVHTTTAEVLGVVREVLG